MTEELHDQNMRKPQSFIHNQWVESVKTTFIQNESTKVQCKNKASFEMWKQDKWE